VQGRKLWCVCVCVCVCWLWLTDVAFMVWLSGYFRISALIIKLHMKFSKENK